MTSPEPAESLVLPLHNPQPATLPNTLVSWYEVLDAYRAAWEALDEVDDHYTAFLAMHVVQNAVDTYKNNLEMRPPKEGDLANLLHLKEHLEASYSRHDTFMDEAHIDYPTLRRTTLTELQNFREDATRRSALHALGLATMEFPSLSYSSSIEDMHTIEEAVRLVEAYYALNPVFVQDLDIRPVVSTLRAIAAQEAKGFPDYKDEEFPRLFEDLTVRLGKLHLASKRNMPRV